MEAAYVDRDIIGHILAALTEPNRLAILASLETGLRIDDVLSLETAQLSQRMTVRERKTGKSRRIRFSRGLYDELRRIAGRKYVFTGRLDWTKHRTRQAVYKDIRRAAVAFRVREHVSPHSARKIYAVEQYRRSGDFSHVQKLLQHSDPAITMIYALADQITARKMQRRRK